jgi:hypothetical protein
MILYSYLDALPHIPDEIIELIYQDRSQEKIETYKDLNGRISYDNKVSLIFSEHLSISVPKKMKEWLDKNIMISPQPCIRSFSPKNNIDHFFAHADKFFTYSLNYIIETGGDDVVTTWYKEPGKNFFFGTQGNFSASVTDDDKLLSVCLEPRRWCLLNTEVLHDVKNLKSRRLFVGLFIDKKDPWKCIPYYSKIIGY